jgi:hypothetical protein
MQISSTHTAIAYAQTAKKRLEAGDVTAIRAEIKSFQQGVAKAALENFGAQKPKSFEAQYADFQKMLEDIGYDGLPIAKLSQDEAAALVAEEGIFGIARTSERLSGFVLNGAGEDVGMLKAGREGMIAGYKEAQKLWGGELPEISQKTLQKALEQIDLRIASLGAGAIDLEA